MATTTFAPALSSDISAYLEKDLLPLTLRELVAYDFCKKLTLPKNRGTTFTMSRYARLPLASAPTAEGVPPIATPLQVSQATVSVQQWTGLVTITDVAELTIFHDVFQIAKARIAMAAAETQERNVFNAFSGFTQVNYVNSRGSRGALLSTDVINTQETQRAYAMLKTLGAPQFRGPMADGMRGSDVKVDAKRDSHARAVMSPAASPHYVAICHPFVAADLRSNPQVQLASAYSDVNRLYNGEFGQWNAIRFVESNFSPFFTGIAAPTTGTPYSVTTSTTGGTLAAGNYQLIVTESDTNAQYESQISQQSANFNIASGTTGSIGITLPAAPGFTFSVYITQVNGTVVGNLATSTSGPTSGSLQGQATLLAPGTTVTLTGIGVGRVPPAAPATGITVYPTFIFGQEAYACVTLDQIKITYLAEPEKTDPANQLRMVAYKYYNGTFLMNNAFAIVLYSASQFNLTFG